MMRKTLLIPLLLIILLPSWNRIANAQSQVISDVEPASGSVVCPPGVYNEVPSDCLPLGPSEFLAQSVEQGLPYPVLPLPAYSPDQGLNDLPYQYFKITEAGSVLFPSLATVLSNQPTRVLPASKDIYVSLKGETVTTRGSTYYKLRLGSWVLGEGRNLDKFNPPFQGLSFSSTPRNAFGWILNEIQSRSSPGVNSPESGITHFRFQVVQIYSIQKADNLIWYLINPSEWVEARLVARVDPLPVPPAGVTGSRWISVNLFQQTIAAYENNRLFFASLVSTGVNQVWTRPGLFRIQKKLETQTMSTSDPGNFYYLADVPWIMYFDGTRALHGAYWHNNFGYMRSAGCVTLSPGDAHWLYDWASEGDFVYVYDPSGQTPTDPELFKPAAP